MVIVGLLVAIKKFKSSKSVVQKETAGAISPVEKALKDIEKLYSEKDSILLKDYYVSFSEIIKVFIGSQIEGI